MKKPIVVSVIMALMLLAWSSFASAQAQDPTTEEKPMFYRLTPGTYVNGWPRFTITYPKDWVERFNVPASIFWVSTPGPAPRAEFIVAPPQTTPTPVPLDKYADILVQFFKSSPAQDVTLVRDKPTQLRDGSPAREIEIQMTMNGEPYNSLSLAMKRGEVWVAMSVALYNGKVGEDLKAILYSLEFQPEKDDLVKVPPDVQEFFDNVNNDILSHDVAKVMGHYSDRFLSSGNRKGEAERFWRQFIGFWTTSQRPVVTDFIPADDRAYLAGFVTGWLGGAPMLESIIKENGEWKFYGNQRDVSP
jgi:hypothetical protein